MKKIAKIFACSLIAALIAFSFVACSNNIDGTYKAKTIKMTKGDITVEVDMNNVDESLSAALSAASDDMKESLENTVNAYKNMSFIIAGDEITTKAGENETTSKFRRDGDLIIALDADGKDVETPGTTMKVVKKTIEIEGSGQGMTMKIVIAK